MIWDNLLLAQGSPPRIAPKKPPSIPSGFLPKDAYSVDILNGIGNAAVVAEIGCRGPAPAEGAVIGRNRVKSLILNLLEGVGGIRENPQAVVHPILRMRSRWKVRLSPRRCPSLPSEYRTHFAPDFMGGQPIESDGAAYPAWEDILETYRKVAQEVVASIRELDDSDLAGPPKGPVPEPLKDRFVVLGSSLAFLAMHNAYHTGQMNLLAALNVNAAAAA